MKIQRSLSIVQPVIVVLACGFVAFLLMNQWEQLKNQAWRIDTGWLVLSTFFLGLSWMFEVLIWQRLLRTLGGYVAYWTGMRIWFLSAIARYIPGNIWQPLSMTIRCQEHGIRAEVTLTSILLYQVVILLAAAPIGVIYIWLTGNWGLLSDWFNSERIRIIGPWLFGATLIPVLLFLLYPAIFIAVLNWGLQMIRRSALDVTLSRQQVLLLLVLAIFDWFLWGTSFAAMAFALADYSVAEQGRLFPHLVASYSMAYAIGFLSFITPSGFGVREGAFYLFLAPNMGGGAVTILAIAMRIWTTVGEVVVALLSAFTDQRIRLHESNH
ncbi:flippase-like domain-containing protein [Chloroflexi bacterium TSY]|nr:flippase-like domain-containing protein [Chloroflexi bacterium TSY]